jgi:hypothetical protein
MNNNARRKNWQGIKFEKLTAHYSVPFFVLITGLQLLNGLKFLPER